MKLNARLKWLIVIPLALAVIALSAWLGWLYLHRGPLRILPMGDSITYGQIYNEPYFYSGYRGYLETYLKRDGIQAEIVGSQKDGHMRMHDGYPGIRIDQLTSMMSGIYARARPDITLLQIGTNDLWQGASGEVLYTRLDVMFDMLHASAGDGVVFVATIPPICSMPPGGMKYSRDAYNQLLEQIVSKHQKHWKKLVLVDLARRHAIGCQNMNDDKHPNDGGYQLLANAWLGVLKEYMNNINK